MTQFSTLITNVETHLSQAAGTGVQRYAQPRIAKMLQDSFDELFIKRFWAGYCEWSTLVLDGTTGKPTTDPIYTRFEDIRIMFRSQQAKKLTQIPPNINPNILTGTDALYVEGCAGSRVFRVWPRTATGSVDVHGRIKPANFVLSDDVKMDNLLLEYLAAWKYSVDDGHNPGQAEKFQQLFNTRLGYIEHALNEIPYELDPRFPSTQNTWQEVE